MMFFMVWAGTVFTAGWVMRIVSSYHTSNLNFYISQSVLIIAGPPIYSAAEYNGKTPSGDQSKQILTNFSTRSTHALFTDACPLASTSGCHRLCVSWGRC